MYVIEATVGRYPDQQCRALVYRAQVQRVFQKLTELTQLDFLDLQSRKPLTDGYTWPVFNLSYGMEHLSGMTS